MREIRDALIRKLGGVPMTTHREVVNRAEHAHKDVALLKDKTEKLQMDLKIASQNMRYWEAQAIVRGKIILEVRDAVESLDKRAREASQCSDD